MVGWLGFGQQLLAAGEFLFFKQLLSGPLCNLFRLQQLLAAGEFLFCSQLLLGVLLSLLLFFQLPLLELLFPYLPLLGQEVCPVFVS